MALYTAHKLGVLKARPDLDCFIDHFDTITVH